MWCLLDSYNRLNPQEILVIERMYGPIFYPTAGEYGIGLFILILVVYFTVIVILGRGPCDPCGVCFGMLAFVILVICCGWSFGEREGEMIKLRD